MRGSFWPARSMTCAGRSAKTRSFPAEYVALVHVGLGDHASALASLELALENRSGGITYLGVEPLMDSLRKDPGFAALLRRVGLQAH
jgi:hypothetical protein